MASITAAAATADATALAGTVVTTSCCFVSSPFRAGVGLAVVEEGDAAAAAVAVIAAVEAATGAGGVAAEEGDAYSFPARLKQYISCVILHCRGSMMARSSLISAL